MTLRAPRDPLRSAAKRHIKREDLMLNRQTYVVDPSKIREMLNYDPESGIFTWRPRAAEFFKTNSLAKSWNTRYAGKRAGSTWTDKKSGYQNREIRLFGKKYREHYLAWMYMTGTPAKHEIDHINRDATDNRWCNLRSLPHAENCRNRPARVDNKSGVTGVRWRAEQKKWQAVLTLNGKSTHLGFFKEIDEAAMATLEFKLENGIPLSHGIGAALRT